MELGARDGDELMRRLCGKSRIVFELRAGVVRGRDNSGAEFVGAVRCRAARVSCRSRSPIERLDPESTGL